ncbi:MAG: prepilin-type N-terminal cleavage/methylation domain-containing protein [Rhodanobacter sp.]
MKRAAGFTLLEVLGALVLLSLLLLGVYSGIRTATHTVHAGEIKIGQMDQIRSSQQFLRRELSQAIAQAMAHDPDGNSIFFTGDAHEMRFVAPLPGYLGRMGPQLQQLKLVSDGEHGMRLEASFAVLPPDGSAPQQVGDAQVLVDGIRGGGFSYRGRDKTGQVMDWQDDWKDSQRMPSLVSINLTLDNGRVWPQLRAPLRVDASAMQGAGDLLRGLRGPGAPQ